MLPSPQCSAGLKKLISRTTSTKLGMPTACHCLCQYNNQSGSESNLSLNEAARTRSRNRGICPAFRNLCRSELVISRRIRTSIGCNPAKADRTAALQKVVGPVSSEQNRRSAQPGAAVPPIPDLSQQQPRAGSQEPPSP